MLRARSPEEKERLSRALQDNLWPLLKTGVRRIDGVCQIGGFGIQPSMPARFQAHGDFFQIAAVALQGVVAETVLQPQGFEQFVYEFVGHGVLQAVQRWGIANILNFKSGMSANSVIPAQAGMKTTGKLRIENKEIGRAHV